MSGSAEDPVDVLLVEDDPGDALMVREYFKDSGKNNRFHVIPDGHQALQFLRRAGRYTAAPRPGLVLLDLNLPGLHGLDVLAEIKADPDLMIIPVVILSSSGNLITRGVATKCTPTPISSSPPTSTASPR